MTICSKNRNSKHWRNLWCFEEQRFRNRMATEILIWRYHQESKLLGQTWGLRERKLLEPNNLRLKHFNRFVKMTSTTSFLKIRLNNHIIWFIWKFNFASMFHNAVSRSSLTEIIWYNQWWRKIADQNLMSTVRCCGVLTETKISI